MRIPFLIILFYVTSSMVVRSQSLLYPGDIAVINVNADGNKNFDVLFLSEVKAGTVIHFTDDAWIGSKQRFRGSEGVLTFTASADIAAGTVVGCPDKSGGNGFVRTRGAFNPAGSGDNIIVYQGTEEDPFFLYGTGWARGATVWSFSTVSASYRSDIPPGLSRDEWTVISPGTSDNYRYDVASGLAGTRGELLQRFADPANYESNNTAAYESMTNHFTINNDIKILTSSTSSTFPTFPYVSLIVRGSVTLSASTTCYELTIEPGGMLEIPPGVVMRVIGPVRNQAGADGLIIRSDAGGSGSLIHSVPGVTGTVERFITGNQWHFISSPVEEAGRPEDLIQDAGCTLKAYYYDETQNRWIDATSLNLVAGRGYDLKSNEDCTLYFKGILNSFRTYGWFGLTKGSGEGWNLLGNPFPCAIDWGTADNNDAPGWRGQASVLAHKTIYITTGGSGAATSWDTYNGSSGIGVPDNHVGVIACGQGFWVRAKSTDSLGIGHYSKSEGQATFREGNHPNPSLSRRGKNHPNPSLKNKVCGEVVRLKIEDEEGDYDRVAIHIDYRGTDGLDSYDSPKWSIDPNRLRIWIEQEGQPLTIASYSSRHQGGWHIPLNIHFPAEAAYKIFFENPGETTFSSLVLEDRLNGLKQDLRQDAICRFRAVAGTLTGRVFQLTMSFDTMKRDVMTGRGAEVVTKGSWSFTDQGEYGRLIHNGLTEGDVLINMYDLNGKRIFSRNIILNDQSVKIRHPLKNGIYIIEILQHGERTILKGYDF
ncbi:MAG: T9SS type A sorting domain-containing protein [Bacteroidales bacterium]|nr:T9SS type A sorting domain-containing protein [Bacteroidales bacterium]